MSAKAPTLTLSQRRALAYVTAQGLFEIHRLERLSEVSRDVFVVVGRTRECWRITARGRKVRLSEVIS